MKHQITINGIVCEYNTREELADIMAVIGVSASAEAPAAAKGKKSGSKATKGKGKAATNSEAVKPTTRKEALEAWANAKGITDESKAKYKALVNSSSDFYQALWAKRSSDKAYNADVKKFGKSVANKNYHKRICELASIESKK